MLNGLGLFEGIGGITLGLKEWVRTVAYCELDPYCQSVLLSRMADGLLPSAPIWDDIKTLKGIQFPQEFIDIVYGGFPCQDISVAGTGEGLAGERSGLYFEIKRIVSDLRPAFVFLENVPAVTLRGLDRIGMDFASIGYDCRWTIVSAHEVGAAHIRERWFCLAHANGERLPQEPRSSKANRGNETKPERSMVSFNKSSSRGASESSEGQAEPRVFRANDGIPYSLDRAQCLGNAVFPAQAREAFRRLIDL